MTSSHQAKALYSAEREKMSSDINQNIVAAIERCGIVVERMLLRDVALPARLQQAIQEKLSAGAGSLADAIHSVEGKTRS